MNNSCAKLSVSLNDQMMIKYLPNELIGPCRLYFLDLIVSSQKDFFHNLEERKDSLCCDLHYTRLLFLHTNYTARRRHEIKKKAIARSP